MKKPKKITRNDFSLAIIEKAGDRGHFKPGDTIRILNKTGFSLKDIREHDINFITQKLNNAKSIVEQETKNRPKIPQIKIALQEFSAAAKKLVNIMDELDDLTLYEYLLKGVNVRGLRGKELFDIIFQGLNTLGGIAEFKSKNLKGKHAEDLAKKYYIRRFGSIYDGAIPQAKSIKKMAGSRIKFISECLNLVGHRVHSEQALKQKLSRVKPKYDFHKVV